MKSIYKASLWLAFICFHEEVFSQSFTLLKDIVSGSGGSNPTGLTNVNGVLFFVATDATFGSELWKSDGTASGTVMVKDIYPGTGGSNPAYLTNVNGTLFFSANDAVHGKELWKSNGTEGGTVLVKDGVVGCCYLDGDNFTNHLEILTSSNDKLFFQARNHETGTELWISNGLETGTAVVEDIFPGTNDGTPDGAPNNSNPRNLTNVNGILYFCAQTPDGFELWKSDGTASGTVLVKDIVTGSGDSNPSNLTNVNGALFFSATDVINGTELWKSNGTSATTVIVKDIFPGSASSDPLWLTNVDGTLYFEAENAANDRELWKSDGTSAGTVLVKDIFEGPGSGHPQSLTNLNGTLFFNVYNGANGFELWKSNGTNATTVMVKDISSGNLSSSPGELTALGAMLLFSASDDIHGREIWKSDGTATGTVMIQNIEPDVSPGGNSSSADPTLFSPRPLNIIEANGKIFMTPVTGTYGAEIWVAENPSIISLPLSILEFKGRLIQNNGFLEWKTSNEANTSVFVIERSIDGRSYINVGTVAAFGRTSGVRNYQFTDPNITFPGAAIIYYRIKQRDEDGRFTYSRIISLPVNSKTAFINLYPNPAGNEANLMISLARDEKLQWEIVDNSGRVLRKNSQPLTAGSTSLGIDVKGLATGIYYLRLQSSSIQKQIQFIKQ